MLERRSEIGRRRALGATKGQIRTQFLGESIVLAVIGGVVGVLAGAAATAVYASSKSAQTNEKTPPERGSPRSG
jgi:putative ABC transport system permease protein